MHHRCNLQKQGKHEEGADVNREIKFRVFVPHTKEMIIQSYSGISSKELQLVSLEINFITGSKKIAFKREGYGHLDWVNHDSILMQFTGVQDKNGMEIYEGDIIRYESTLCYTVIYSSDSAAFLFREELTGQLHEPFNLTLGEIIGNIYENHKLVNP